MPTTVNYQVFSTRRVCFLQTAQSRLNFFKPFYGPIPLAFASWKQQILLAANHSKRIFFCLTLLWQLSTLSILRLDDDYWVMMRCLAAGRQQNTLAWLYGDTLMTIFTSGQMRLILGENLYIFVCRRVSKFSMLCDVKGLCPPGCFSSERLEVNLILARFLAVFCWTFNPIIVNFQLLPRKFMNLAYKHSKSF